MKLLLVLLTAVIVGVGSLTLFADATELKPIKGAVKVGGLKLSPIGGG